MGPGPTAPLSRQTWGPAPQLHHSPPTPGNTGPSTTAPTTPGTRGPGTRGLAPRLPRTRNTGRRGSFPVPGTGSRPHVSPSPGDAGPGLVPGPYLRPARRPPGPAAPSASPAASMLAGAALAARLGGGSRPTPPGPAANEKRRPERRFLQPPTSAPASVAAPLPWRRKMAAAGQRWGCCREVEGGRRRGLPAPTAPGTPD